MLFKEGDLVEGIQLHGAHTLKKRESSAGSPYVLDINGYGFTRDGKRDVKDVFPSIWLAGKGHPPFAGDLHFDFKTNRVITDRKNGDGDAEGVKT